MRVLPLVITAIVLAGPALPGQAPQLADGTPFFLRKPEPPADALQAYREKPYRPVRPSELRAAGFLIEANSPGFGRALGPVSPPQVRGWVAPAVTSVGTIFAVRPPDGTTYTVGDTLVVAIVESGPRHWGDAVIPTGLLVVSSQGERQTLTNVVAIYGTLRAGQAVYPAGTVTDPGQVTPVPTPSGPRGEVIASRQARELLTPGNHMFIDLGSTDGMKVGDFVSIRRRPEPRTNAAATIDEEMATAQVVHVSQESSTIKLINVLSPSIPPGTPVVRVASLP